MLVQLRQWRCVQELVLLMATLVTVLARVKEFVMPAGAVANGSRTVLLPVRVTYLRPDMKTSRYSRTARGFPGTERASRINPAVRPSSWSSFPE